MAVLEVERRDHVTLLTLNRPDARNALSPELIARLAAAWDDVRADDTVRAVVLTGARGSTFCAGFDLALSIPLLTGAREPENEWDEALVSDPGLAPRAMLRGEDLGVPLVVAANGHAIAGGMEILMAADLRVMAAGAKLGLSEVRLGLIPGMGGNATLARQIPPAVAAELLLTARNVTAERGYETGLVNRVVPADDVLDAALDLAGAIGANAPLAVRAAREVLRASLDLDETAALALEQEKGAALTRTEDAVEGPRAFLEKRPPVFKGR